MEVEGSKNGLDARDKQALMDEVIGEVHLVTAPLEAR